MIILPRGLMTEANVQALRKNDICVVEAKDPAKVRFVDPIPAASSRTTIEEACIKLSRCLLNWNLQGNKEYLSKGEVAGLYMHFLMKGTPLDQMGTIQEQEQRIIDDARHAELCKIGREEARARKLAAASTEKSSPPK